MDLRDPESQGSYLFPDEIPTINSEAELLTASEVVKQLEECWMNELLSPELLPSQSELVDCLMEQTKHMEENLLTVSKSDFRFALHRMEVERLHYIVTSYLRVRIEKIERFLTHVLNEESQRSENSNSLLSPGELKFAHELNSAIESHMKTLALRHMPANMREMNVQKSIVYPNRDSYVFVHVKQDSPSVIVDNRADGDQQVDLLKGSQHLLPYKSIVAHLNNGHVGLL